MDVAVGDDTALGLGEGVKPPPSREGLTSTPDGSYDAFFVDLQKAERDYSPTTMGTLENGVVSPYVFLGPAQCVSSTGDRPVAFTWRLETPMPEELFAVARTVAAA